MDHRGERLTLNMFQIQELSEEEGRVEDAIHDSQSLILFKPLPSRELAPYTPFPGGADERLHEINYHCKIAYLVIKSFRKGLANSQKTRI
jgi:hypothetical protein